MNHDNNSETGLELTGDQVEFFNTFGYVVLKQFFSADELATIRREFDHAMNAQYAHKPFDGTARHWTMMMEPSTPFFASLMEQSHLLSIAKRFYGEDVLGIGVDANRYVGNSNWHRDTRTVLQYGIKFAFYLEPVDADSGALRVIPGTQRLPDDEAFGVGVRKQSIEQVPAQVLASEPGDIVGFDLRLWHASYGGSDDRHMCTVVYYANPKTLEGEQVLREQAARNVEISFKKFGCKRQYMYSRAWFANPERNPDRQWWIDRLSQLGYFEPPGVVESAT
jgi:hypothetical protein